MYRADDPKFVEATVVQLICPYCGPKFLAPQNKNMVTQKQMQERVGDRIRPKVKLFIIFDLSSKNGELDPLDTSRRRAWNPAAGVKTAAY